jgi:hypothetical protein
MKFIIISLNKLRGNQVIKYREFYRRRITVKE